MDISEVKGRLIIDIIEVCGLCSIKALLVTLDIEGNFDKLDHSFLTKATVHRYSTKSVFFEISQDSQDSLY